MATFWSKAAAIALAAGIATTGGAALGHAQEAGNGNNVVSEQQAQQLSNTIDFSRTGSLTIQKTLNAEQGPLSGVEFTIRKLDFDLRNPSDVATANRISPAEALAKHVDQNATPVTVVTDENGQAVAEDLPVGIYVVEETKTPDGDILPGGPFLVSLPYTNDEGNGWNYDLTVKPKNTLNITQKTVVDEDRNQGDRVDYEITSFAPVVARDEVLTSYAIEDGYRSSELSDVKIDGVTVGGQEFAEGTDYTVETGTLNGTDQDPQADSSITVNFTQAGLEKLAKITDRTVVVKVSGELGELGDGEVINAARSLVRNPGESSTSEPKTTPWDDARTYLGKLRLHKIDGKNNERALSGASFDLYRCDAQGNLQGDAIEKDVVSDQDGIVDFKTALHVTDYENDDAVAQVTKRFCAKETKAPSGFSLLSEPVVIDFKRSDLTESYKDVNNIQKTADVENFTGPQLPSTGGMGIVALIIAGLAVIGGGAYMARRNSQKA